MYYRSFKMRGLSAFLLCSVFLFVSSLHLFGSEDLIRVDNNVVRIAELEFAPHVPRTMLRQDKNRLLVSLGPGNIRLIYADGRKSRQHWATGQVLWIPAGESDTSENVGSAPMRIIEIKLKNAGPVRPATRNPELDPIAIDPKHNILLLENDEVRVFRSWREPGAAEKMHEHVGAGRAAVLLTDLDAKVKLADGSISALRASSGNVLWRGTVTHATTNLGLKKFNMIVVEVK